MTFNKTITSLLITILLVIGTINVQKAEAKGLLDCLGSSKCLEGVVKHGLTQLQQSLDLFLKPLAQILRDVAARLNLFPGLNDLLFQEYKKYINSKYIDGSIGQPISAEIITYYQPLFSENLSTVRIFETSKQGDIALTDCKDIYFPATGIVSKILNNRTPAADGITTIPFHTAKNDDDLRWMLHELAHVDQCKQIGGRYNYAVFWFLNLVPLDIAQIVGLGNTISRKQKRFVHDAMPMEIDAEEYAKAIIAGTTTFAKADICPASYKECIKQADFNGDGKQDILAFGADGNIYVWLTKVAGGGFEPQVSWGTYNPRSYNYRIGDFNGDGKSDIISLAGNMNVSLSTGTSFAPATSWGYNPFITIINTKIGDFDGDGKSDLLYLDNSIEMFLQASDGASFSAKIKWALDFSRWQTLDMQKVKLGDFNGDGRTDILIGQRKLISNGRAYSYQTWSPSTFIAGETRVGDFDGDGTDDVMLIDNWSHNIYVWYRGIQTDWARIGATPLSLGHYKVGDVNGDGKSDLISIGGRIHVYLSTGAGNFSTKLSDWGSSMTTLDSSRYFIGNFTNDNRMDMVTFDTNSVLYGWKSAVPLYNGFIPRLSWGTQSLP